MPIKSVFISHVTAEAAVADALKRGLEQALDVSAFASSTDINLGVRWLSEIDNALDAANAVLVLCSRWSVARRWINFEAGAGWGQKKPVSVAPGGSEWLRVGSNAVYRPRADTVDYFENTLIQPKSKKCIRVRNVGGTPVAVQAPAGLCGAGAVCAIGTWQIRNNNPETQMLVERLLNWLATGHVHGKP